jgi:hypothetical protein
MLDEARADAIFQEIDKYTLELANDPSSLGPTYFQDIIATCRNYLNCVSLILSELDRYKLTVSSELRALEAEYQLDYNNLIANDDRVKALANVEDRKSTACFLLRDQQEKINEAKSKMHMLDVVHKTVTHRSRELHSTMTAIKDQRRLMQTMLDTGAFYGDERVPKTSRTPREADGIGLDGDDGGLDMSDLDSMLGSELDSDSESETPKPSVGAAPAEVVEKSEPEAEKNETTSEDAEVVRFLESPDETPQPVVEEAATEDMDDEMAEVMSMLDSL